MKVLFVASGNSKDFNIVPFIKSQGESIREQGIEISYFPVLGNGLKGYMSSAPRLKEWLRENPVDLIHAHYGLCGWVAVLARPKQPIVLSLMGTDAYGEYSAPNKVIFSSRYLTMLTYMIQPFVTSIICKSANIEAFVYRKKISQIVPNGVKMVQFKIYEGGCREELGLDPDKQYVLFLGNKADNRKNYELARKAVEALNRPGVELINPYPIPHDTVVKYMNSVDAFVMCSLVEGSPNVVKEAMACRCPIVVTDVGDAAWVVGEEPGCHVASFDPMYFAEKLGKALDFSREHGRTRGRERILALGLDAETIAKRILTIYQKTLRG